MESGTGEWNAGWEGRASCVLVLGMAGGLTICNAGRLSLSKPSSESAEDPPQQFRERKKEDILAPKEVDIVVVGLESRVISCCAG